MSEVTYSEFAGLLNRALHHLKREWEQGHRCAPDEFPERMPVEEWWEHFTCIEVPEVILAQDRNCAAEGPLSRHANARGYPSP